MSEDAQKFPEDLNKGLKILEEADASGLLGALITQVQKDYLRAGVADPFGKRADELDFPKIITDLRDHMYLLLMEAFDQHLSLMYAIDVPEKAYRELGSADPVEAAGQLTGIILSREWEKVKWRNRYSGSWAH